MTKPRGNAAKPVSIDLDFGDGVKALLTVDPADLQAEDESHRNRTRLNQTPVAEAHALTTDHHGRGPFAIRHRAVAVAKRKFGSRTSANVLVKRRVAWRPATASSVKRSFSALFSADGAADVLAAASIPPGGRPCSFAGRPSGVEFHPSG